MIELERSKSGFLEDLVTRNVNKEFHQPDFKSENLPMLMVRTLQSSLAAMGTDALTSLADDLGGYGAWAQLHRFNNTLRESVTEFISSRSHWDITFSLNSLPKPSKEDEEEEDETDDPGPGVVFSADIEQLANEVQFALTEDDEIVTTLYERRAREAKKMADEAPVHLIDAIIDGQAHGRAFIEWAHRNHFGLSEQTKRDYVADICHLQIRVLIQDSNYKEDK